LPLFSILIPTRNRAHLLKYAIQSVLNQDCDDYELIVSDNNSSDDTYKITMGFDSQKIRYVNTGKYLPGSASWNFAYTQAIGDYILILGDDDYLVPGILTQVKKIIQKKSARIVFTGIVGYYDNSFRDENLRNTIQSRVFTGKLIEVSTKQIIQAYFNFGGRIDPPHPSSIFIFKKIADKVNEEYGAFYAPPYPEFTAILRSISQIDNLFLIDKPLVIVGKTSQTWSANVGLYGREVRSYEEEIGDKFLLSLFSGRYIHNGIAESLLRVKHSNTERFKEYNIHLERYCCLYYQDVLEATRMGVDTSADLKEFYQKLSTLPSNIQKNVRKYILKARVKEFLRKSPLQNMATIKILKNKLKILFKKDNMVKKFIRGDSVGVYDIASCADYLIKIT